MLVVVLEPFDDRVRLLRGGGIVEPYQLLAVNAFLQDREVAPNVSDIESTPIEIRHRTSCRLSQRWGQKIVGTRAWRRAPRVAARIIEQPWQRSIQTVEVERDLAQVHIRLRRRIRRGRINNIRRCTRRIRRRSSGCRAAAEGRREKISRDAFQCGVADSIDGGYRFKARAQGTRCRGQGSMRRQCGHGRWRRNAMGSRIG